MYLVEYRSHHKSKFDRAYSFLSQALEHATDDPWKPSIRRVTVTDAKTGKGKA